MNGGYKIIGSRGFLRGQQPLTDMSQFKIIQRTLEGKESSRGLQESCVPDGSGTKTTLYHKGPLGDQCESFLGGGTCAT